MVCPNCKTEYRAGFFICADCNMALVNELPPSSDVAEYVDLVGILNTNDRSVIPFVKSAVYTGILPVTQYENGRAVVLGHEVATPLPANE